MFDRINKLKLILWIIIGVAASVAVTRFLFGLGVTTNLSDNTPWGFWIGFDVMGGVALAAGGFVIAAFNYIFRKEAMHSISRAAILTAFLGYLAVAVGLLFDLGLPWNIWHMIIFWNPHSPLFEVGWCVMLYLSVLTLEFAPVVLEKYPQLNFLRKIHKFLNKIKIPIVILGIMLSTLHQSSLGSLFLAMPYRLHPLWYSPIIPIIFFVSAICLGLMMVMVESLSSSYLYRKPFEHSVLNQLRKPAIFMLITYALIRFADILFRGAEVFLFDGTWGAILFWIELSLSVALPLIFIYFAKNRVGLLYSGAIIGVIGVVFNRLNVGGLTHLNNLTDIGTFYFPSWMELTISAGVVSVAMIVFFYFIENFNVWDERPKDQYSDPKKHVNFSFNRTYFGTNNFAVRNKVSLAFVIAFGVGFAAMSGSRLESEGLEKVKVSKARGGDTLMIDGNKDGYGVMFDHSAHIASQKNCSSCHHLNLPGDDATGCYECHSFMYTEGDAFNHDWHTSADGASLKCFDCHTQGSHKAMNFHEKQNFTEKLCVDCHEDIFPKDAKSKILSTYKTVSYTDAMHNSCIKCHNHNLKIDTELQVSNPDLDRCDKCHSVKQNATDKKLFKNKKTNKWVVVPPKIK